MISKLFTAASTAAFVLGATVAPLAAQETPEETPGYMQETPADDSANLIGQSVYDSSGQQVGKVESVEVAADGTEQAILSVGGFLGMGSKKIAVPSTDLTPLADGTGYTIALTAEEIEAAPEYQTESEPLPQ